MNVPRKSAAALSVVVPINVAARLRPPRSLTKAEAEVFNELAGHAAHLRPSDTPTLASYAQSIVLCRKLGRNPDKADVWQKLTRVQMALARSLRLTPLSRTDTDSRAVGRQHQTPGSDPWSV